MTVPAQQILDAESGKRLPTILARSTQIKAATLLMSIWLCCAASVTALAQTPNFSLPAEPANLPPTGPNAWCGQPETVKSILLSVNQSDGVKKSGLKMIDFKNATTMKIDLPSQTFACHGSLLASNGQMWTGTFFNQNVVAGDGTWQWADDDKVMPTASTSSNYKAPADEAGFVELIIQVKKQYEAAETDFQKGAMRVARANLMCETMKGRNVANWLGKVTTLTTNGDGKGVLAIELTPDIHIKTWNNALSDIGSNTLVEPGTSVFAAMGKLRPSDKVKFSGTFFPDKTDCIKEGSLTLSGSMTAPEYIMRFSGIERLD